MKKFRFNTYYTVGQEVVTTVEDNQTEEDAREQVMNGIFETVGDTWDVGDIEVESVPNPNDEELESDQEDTWR